MAMRDLPDLIVSYSRLTEVLADLHLSDAGEKAALLLEKSLLIQFIGELQKVRLAMHLARDL